MNIEQILLEAKKRIGKDGDLMGIEVLLAFVVQKDRTYLIAHPEAILSQAQQEKFFLLFERFLRGEPVAYLTHNKEFFGLDFYVDARVLIPRPETELLVEKVLEYLKAHGKSSALRILEIGTGSGCIAVALAKNNAEVKVTATDVSLEALEVARFNAQKHQVLERICFEQSDLLEQVSSSFDLIVANLPYIGRERFSFVSKEVYQYEPHLALFAGQDGLLLYEKLFQQLKQQSWKPRLFLGEFGFLQGQEIERLYREYFAEIANALEIFTDYAKIERVFMIRF